MVEERWEESLQSVFGPRATSKAFLAVTLVDQMITSSFPSFPLAHSTLLHRREKEKKHPQTFRPFFVFLTANDQSELSVFSVALLSQSVQYLASRMSIICHDIIFQDTDSKDSLPFSLHCIL